MNQHRPVGYIKAGLCLFHEDNKGPSDRMVGYYYCVVHKVRVSDASVPCFKGRRGRDAR